MKIKGTDKVKGELVLSSINMSIRKGQERVITPEDVYRVDVHRMLKAGLLELVDAPDGLLLDEEIITLQNLHKKPLVLPTLPEAIKPFQTCKVTASEFQNRDIQQALAAKLIQVVEDGTLIAKPASEQAIAASKVSPVDLENLREKVEAEKKAAVDDVLKKMASEFTNDPDIQMEDDAERFKKTGEAVTLHKEEPKIKDPNPIPKPYDPRPDAAKRDMEAFLLASNLKGKTIAPKTEEAAKTEEVTKEETPKTEPATETVKAADLPKIEKKPKEAPKKGKKGIKPVGRVKEAGKTPVDDSPAEDDGIEML